MLNLLTFDLYLAYLLARFFKKWWIKGFIIMWIVGLLINNS